MKIKINKIPYYILFALTLYMPFHYWICELLIRNTSLDNIMRDILIVLMLLMVALSSKIYRSRETSLIVFNCVILTVFAFVSFAIKSYPNTFNILRNYLMPMIVCLSCMNMNIIMRDLRILMKCFIVELGIIGIYGIIQAFVIGPQFIINMGYPSVNGYLEGSSYYINGFFGFQRSVGTFVSPNAFGGVLAIALGMLLFSQVNFDLKHYNLWIVILLIGLVGTISRSSILGLFLIAFVRLFGHKKIGKKRLIRLIWMALVSLAIIWFADRYCFNGMLLEMLTSAFNGMFGKKDLSSQKHLSDLVEPLKTIIDHPFGRWFGANGPLAPKSNLDALNVESSIYLMMYEVGPLFGLLYFIPIVNPIAYAYKINRKKYNFAVPVCVIILFISLVLPVVQTYETMFYSFMIIGLAFNKNVECDEEHKAKILREE